MYVVVLLRLSSDWKIQHIKAYLKTCQHFQRYLQWKITKQNL